MSDRDKTLLASIIEVIPQIPEFFQGELYGYAKRIVEEAQINNT